MNPVTKEQLRELSQITGPSCVSIYVPIDGSRDHRAAQIKLKKLRTRAAELLAEGGMRPTEARDLVAAPFFDEALADLRAHHIRGLGFFVAPGTKLRSFAVAAPVPEQVAVGGRFVLRHLLGDAESHLDALVLILDANHIRLISVGGAGCRELHIAGMPQQLSDVAGAHEFEKQMQSHTAGAVGRSGSQITHGVGDLGSDRKEQLARLYRVIDQSICRHFARTPRSLVLAAQPHEAAIYREFSKYPFLEREGVERGMKGLAEEDVRDAVCEVMQRERRAALAGLVERFHAAESRDQASRELTEVLGAAQAQRVAVLLVREERSGVLEGMDEVGEECLALAIASGAEAHQVPDELMPVGANIAAIYRY